VTVGTVAKVGGSLLAEPELPALLACLEELAGKESLVLVPGGGPFADAVRTATAARDPGASAAHWMAILAMDQHAHFIAGLLPSARLVSAPLEIERTVAEGRLALLCSFPWLRAENPLPHGWHVTSDSIAAWAAGRLGARRLVLLKAVEGVLDETGAVLGEVDRRSPALAGVVDGYFGEVLRPGLECWLLSGRHPERIRALLRDGRAPGTRVR
jgi:aspartokinase-like uncharacterized kinase